MRAWVEVDAAAIRANVLNLKRYVCHAEVIAVIKGDGYGHGLEICAAAARSAGVSRLAVSDLSELRQLRQKGDYQPVLVLGPFLSDEIRGLLELKAEIVLSDAISLKQLAAEAETTKTVAHLHLAVETGLGRDGFLPDALPPMVDFIRSQKFLKIAGIMSHLRTSRDESSAAQQLALFERVTSCFPRTVLRHLAHSGGIALGSRYFLDAVRPGLAIYGLSESCSKKVPLIASLSLRTQIAQIHNRPQGASVGYGAGFKLSRDSRLGVLPIGYAHGYPRNATGPVLVNGERLRIIGKVNMLTTVVDLTDAPSASVGDRVTLLGRDGNEEIKAADLCRGDDLIPNQFTCTLTGLIGRSYVNQIDDPAPTGNNAEIGNMEIDLDTGNVVGLKRHSHRESRSQ